MTSGFDSYEEDEDDELDKQPTKILSPRDDSKKRQTTLSSSSDDDAGFETPAANTTIHKSSNFEEKEVKNQKLCGIQQLVKNAK